MKYLFIISCILFCCYAFAQSADSNPHTISQTQATTKSIKLVGAKEMLNTTLGTDCPTKINILSEYAKYCIVDSYHIARREYVSTRKPAYKPLVWQNQCYAYDAEYQRAWYGIVERKKFAPLFSVDYEDKPLVNSVKLGYNNCKPRQFAALPPTAPTRTLTIYLTADIRTAKSLMRNTSQYMNPKDSSIFIADTVQNVVAMIEQVIKLTDYVLVIRDQVNNVTNEVVETLLIDKGVRYVAFIDKERSTRSDQTLGGIGKSANNAVIYDDQKTPAFFYLHLLPDSEISISSILTAHFQDKNDWYAIGTLLDKKYNLGSKKPKLRFMIGFF